MYLILFKQISFFISSIISSLYSMYQCIQIFLCNFFGDFNNYNYIEFFSWASSGIITILGLLTVFLSAHYQDNILKAKQILWTFKTEILDFSSFSKFLLEYSYLTTKAIKGYYKAVKLFKLISIFTVFMWILSALAYLVRIQSIGGKIIIFLSVTFLSIFLYRIYNMFNSLSSDNEIDKINDLLDVNQFDKYYKSEILLEGLIKPIIQIKRSNINDSIEFELNTPVNITNYLCALNIKKDDFYTDIFFKLSEEIPLEVDNFISESVKKYTLCNRPLNNNMFENMALNPEITLFIKGTAETLNWNSFSCELSINEDNGLTTYIIKTKKLIDVTLPIALDNLIKTSSGEPFKIQSNIM